MSQTISQITVPPLPWTAETAVFGIEALDQSGLSVTAFSELYEIPQHRIFYWKRKLRERQEITGAAARLLPVRLHGGTTSQEIKHSQEIVEVQTPNGFVIRLKADIDESFFGKILQVCGGQS